MDLLVSTTIKFPKGNNCLFQIPRLPSMKTLPHKFFADIIGQFRNKLAKVGKSGVK
jgi:hypothetical protein